MEPDNEDVVWSPVLIGGGVRIMLSRPFALRCRAHRFSDMHQFAKGVWVLAGFELERMTMPSNFLHMEEGILPKGFYANMDGLWLTRNEHLRSENVLVYDSHNAMSTNGRMWILRAFDAWVAGAKLVLDFHEH